MESGGGIAVESSPPPPRPRRAASGAAVPADELLRCNARESLGFPAALALLVWAPLSEVADPSGAVEVEASGLATETTSGGGSSSLAEFLAFVGAAAA